MNCTLRIIPVPYNFKADAKKQITRNVTILDRIGTPTKQDSGVGSLQNFQQAPITLTFIQPHPTPTMEMRYTLTLLKTQHNRM